MKNYYFTFGQAHYTEDGIPMQHYWVRVTAPDYGSARNHFCQFWALPMMGRHDKWSFQYEEHDFKPGYFPGGEFEHLTVSLPTGQAEATTPVQECDATDGD